jgi:hypothetical protein
VTAPEHDWRATAESTHAALAALGWPPDDCLPDGPAPCGADYWHHAAADYGALLVLAGYIIAHLGPEAAGFVNAGADHMRRLLRESMPACTEGHNDSAVMGGPVIQFPSRSDTPRGRPRRVTIRTFGPPPEKEKLS